VRNTIRLIVVYWYGKIYGTSTECWEHADYTLYVANLKK